MIEMKKTNPSYLFSSTSETRLNALKRLSEHKASLKRGDRKNGIVVHMRDLSLTTVLIGKQPELLITSHHTDLGNR